MALESVSWNRVKTKVNLRLGISLRNAYFFLANFLPSLAKLPSSLAKYYNLRLTLLVASVISSFAGFFSCL